MKAQMYDASLRIGRYSYDFLYSRYKDAMQDLYNQHFHGPNRTNSQVRLLEDLMKLNNDFAGLGLPTNVLSSGNDFATQTAIIENYDLVSGLIEFNGTADKAEQLKASFGKREGWAFMSRKEREEYMSSSELAPTYRLEAAFVHKKMIGKHKDSEDGKNDDIITGYTYFYVTEQGDKVTTTLHVDPSAQSNGGGDPPTKSSIGLDGWEHAAGPSLYLLGQQLDALKPVGALGSKSGSSIASKTLSKVIPQTFTKTLGKEVGTKVATKIGTNVIGRALGRFVPIAGWALTVYDFGSFLFEHEAEIQRGMEDRNRWIQEGVIPFR